LDEQFLMYQAEDGQTKIEVRLEDETVWLSQAQMAELFQTTKQNVSLHIHNAFDEGELDPEAVVKEYLTTADDGKNYRTKFYNLDVIISVGYRVKSLRGTQFRIWATQRLREYIIKGFTMNDDLLKKAGGGNYWKELLQRIRDIRSSEKVFYRQVLDIYYDPRAEESKRFFKVVQNKMHYAAHGHTASELILLRADAEVPFMGLKTFDGARPRRDDVTNAKNYLNEDELNILNRIVSAYLEFAELQAIRRKPMYMKDWIRQLDMFITMSGSELLQNAGRVSHMEAETKALLEYEKYKAKSADELSPAELDFLESMKKAQKKLEGKGS
jgi:hypothetical protein